MRVSNQTGDLLIEIWYLDLALQTFLDNLKDRRGCISKQNISKYSAEYGKQDTVQPISVLTKASVCYEIRVIWANISQVKSHAMALAFILQTDMI